MTTEHAFRARPRYVSRPRDVAKCECCDHPLQHTIRYALNEYENGYPIVTLRAIMGNLRDSLEQWEDNS